MKGLLMTLLVLCSIMGYSQEDCGQVEPTTPMPYSVEELKAEISKLKSGERGEARVFMVDFTIVRSAIGQGGLDPNVALQALKK